MITNDLNGRFFNKMNKEPFISNLILFSFQAQIVDSRDFT